MAIASIIISAFITFSIATDSGDTNCGYNGLWGYECEENIVDDKNIEYYNPLSEIDDIVSIWEPDETRSDEYNKAMGDIKAIVDKYYGKDTSKVECDCSKEFDISNFDCLKCIPEEPTFWDKVKAKIKRITHYEK